MAFSEFILDHDLDAQLHPGGTSADWLREHNQILQKHISLTHSHSRVLHDLKKHIKRIGKASPELKDSLRAQRKGIDRLCDQAARLFEDAQSAGKLFVRRDYHCRLVPHLLPNRIES